MRVHGGDILSYEAQFHKKPLDFSVNVSPIGLPDGVRQAVIDALDDAGEYPDTDCRELRQALAEYHGVKPDWVLCGNGAADLIDRLAFALQGKGNQKILLTAPTFTEYRFAFERVGLKCISYALNPEEGFGIREDFPDYITPDLTAVMLCEPNNPTGKTTERALLIRILEKCKSCGVMLIIDECFQDFLDEPEEHTMQKYLDEPEEHTMQKYLDEPEEHTMQKYLDEPDEDTMQGYFVDSESDADKTSEIGNPLLILKSFTKTYAMAGVRLGYCLCADQDLLEKMEQAAQPWAVSGLAQAAGIAALKETSYLQTLRAQNRAERERLKVALADAGCKCVQGEANYILFWHERADLAERLAKQGILIRTCTDYDGLNAHWYRVAVLKKENNDRLVETIASASQFNPLTV